MTIHDYEINWQLHGDGPERITFIQGLISSMYHWKDVVQHFGPDRFSVLVLDNRGVGKSTRGESEWTTRTMAEDVVAVWDHLGWIEPKSMHVVGNTIGEMAYS